MRRRITGPLLISILMHLALGIVLLVGVNIEPPKRPAGTPGAIVHAVVIDRLEFNQHAQFVRKQQQQKKEQEEERVQQQKAEAEAVRQQKQEEVVRLRKAEAERKAAKEAERKQEVERQRKEAENKLALQKKKKEEELKKKQEAEKKAEEQKKLLAEKKAEELRKKQEAEKKADEQKKLAEKKAEEQKKLAEKKAEELKKKKEDEKKAELARKQKLKEQQDAKRLEEELFSDLDTPNANDRQNNPSASGSPGETDAYQGLIVATIQRYWLVDQTMFGKECQLKVQLAPDGLVVSVGGGQGDSAVCRASIAAINRIEKFPAPPKGIYESAKNLSLTLQPGSR